SESDWLLVTTEVPMDDKIDPSEVPPFFEGRTAVPEPESATACIETTVRDTGAMKTGFFTPVDAEPVMWNGMGTYTPPCQSVRVVGMSAVHHDAVGARVDSRGRGDGQ